MLKTELPTFTPPIRGFFASVVVLVNTASCSINNIGTPNSIERHTEFGKFGELRTTRATGVHIYTNPSFGFHIGEFERSSLHPALLGNLDVCIPLNEEYKNSSGQKSHAITLTPTLISTVKIGGGIDIGHGRIRLNLGLSNVRMLRVPSNRSMVLYVSDQENSKISEFCSAVKTTKENCNENKDSDSHNAHCITDRL